MKKTERLLQLDIARGIGILFVILGHSIISYPVNCMEVKRYALLRTYIYSFHMPFFFMLSGITYECINYKRYLYSRIQRILLPYVFFAVLNVLMHAIGGNLVSTPSSLKDGMLEVVFYGGGYWFLYVLFLICISYPLISKVIKSNKQKFVFLCLLQVLFVFFDMPSIFTIDKYIYYLSFFIIGNLFGSAIYRKKNLRQNNCKTKGIVIILLLFLYAILMCIRSSTSEQYILKISGYFCALSMSSFWFILIDIYVIISNKVAVGKITDFLTFCSMFSLQFYLFNDLIMVILRTIICNIFNITFVPLIVWGIFLIDVVVSIFLCKYIVPCVPGLRMMCGIMKAK